MKPRYYIFTILLLLSTNAFSQNARFAASGIIEFEKSSNMHALIKKVVEGETDQFYAMAFEQYKKNQPQFKKLKSTLTFSNNKTLFVPQATSVMSNSYFEEMPMSNQPNTIFSDLANNKRTIQKKAFDETFLLQDTLRKIKWKLTTETREIAGYQCRRANGLVLDSVYVVAFYTDEIPVSGGPESFNGLPGMILGLAMPHENITWFATKVTDTTVPVNTVTPPVKGKLMTPKEFIDKLAGVMKDWGNNYKRSALLAFNL